MRKVDVLAEMKDALADCIYVHPNDVGQPTNECTVVGANTFREWIAEVHRLRSASNLIDRLSYELFWITDMDNTYKHQSWVNNLKAQVTLYQQGEQS